jgi:16S rRNA (uracil1498-N3)-methyltransferase
VSAPVFHHVGLAGAAVGDEVVLNGDEGRHAVTVRRLTAGEAVDLVDGEGLRVSGRVVSATRPDRLQVALEAVRRDPDPVPRITVVQALPKGERGELAVELLTEVGADELVPWAASRCVARWRPGASDQRWRRAAQEAAKQARRARFPRIHEVARLDGVVARAAAAERTLVLHEGASTSLDEVDGASARDVLVVVGPEGGLADDERAALRAVGGVEVRLGPTVLRASTAGVVAVAALLSRTPRWGAVEG